MSPIEIIPAHLSEMGYFTSKALDEGWNPGLNDALPFYSTDPSGFFLAKKDGLPIGCISAVAYDDTYGFMGFYIVEPEYRGEGLGLKLWERAIDHLGNRAIGLDGVVAQQENYKKSGFQLHYKNVRYEGKGSAAGPHQLVPLKRLPLEELLAYDTAIYGVKRFPFLLAWSQMEKSHALCKKEEGRVTGYGVIRKCHQGFKIGPLFADSLAIATEILTGLIAYAGNDSYYLDIPAINIPAQTLVESFSLKPVFETARMYKGTPPSQDINKVFGVTTFELG